MINEKITNLLISFEQKYNVKILFAIENGSRAWGMESANSDYDVRFVYYRDFHDYLKLGKLKDVITESFDKNLSPCDAQGALYDFSGFDIFKYFHLLHSSNPTAIEWLNSPIVYLGNNDLPVRSYMTTHFSQERLFYHYHSVYKRMRHRYVEKLDKPTYKKYLYCFRGLLNAKYVYEFNKIPPLLFTKTVEEMKDKIPTEVYSKIKEVIKIKALGQEKEVIPPIQIFDDYFDAENQIIYDHFDKKMPEENFLNTAISEILLK